MDIAGKQVTVIGGKRSGMASARLAVAMRGKVKISEKDREDCLTREFKDWASTHDVRLEFSGHTQRFVEDSDLIILSPGVRFDAPPVQWAKEKGILVLGEIEFAAQFCTKPIIAITGSNGKTTVSTLTRNILDRAGHRACLCGNVGFPFSEFVLDLDHVDYVVLEISSFQLESVLDPASPFRTQARDGLTVRGFRPRVAAILNFSQNHLDRHKDLQEYFDAKKRIFLNQGPDDFAVLNFQNPQLRELSSQIKSKVVYFNSDAQGAGITNPNYSAVMEIGKVLGVSEEVCRKVFREFKGVEHRLETVRSLDGIRFINDSKATTAEAALWALKSIDQPIVMICGGRDKNIDFSVLAEAVRAKVKKMFVIGEARAKIRKAFEHVISLEECDGLEDAVTRARRNASQMDCVLFSPMCTSFDMFANFEERGRVFKDIVNRLN